jgi:hypothetical protein
MDWRAHRLDFGTHAGRLLGDVAVQSPSWVLFMTSSMRIAGARPDTYRAICQAAHSILTAFLSGDATAIHFDPIGREQRKALKAAKARLRAKLRARGLSSAQVEHGVALRFSRDASDLV